VKKEDLLNDETVRQVRQSSVGKILIIDERNFKSTGKEEDKRTNDAIEKFKYDPGVRNAGTIILTSEKLSWGVSTFQALKPVLVLNRDIKDIAVARLDIDARLINYTTGNIIGFTEGEEHPDSFLVVLAHYDHLGKMGSEVYFPGANDNSSGVAMLLNLAKYFKEHSHKYSVVFIALTAEEAGLLGAKYFVENPLFDLSRIAFLVNFDLAGTGDEGIKVVNGSVYKDKFDLLTSLNEQGGYLKSVQIRGAACNSDHCMFHNQGVPCFYIYTLGGIQAYHDVYDRSETLPLTEFEDYTQLMIRFFEHIP
jgi:Iap family predicted aminopeptidase